MKRASFAASILSATLSPLVARAQTPPRVRVNCFPGAPALPLAYALERGFFRVAGLDVSATATSSSVDQFTRLDRGEFEIAHTAFDNPVAYDIGLGAPGVAARDFVAWFGIDDGSLRLVSRPGIARIADLRGATVAVDAPTTGWAFVLQAMLASAGVGSSDVTYVAKGATSLRYRALLDGAFDATLLTPPFDAQAIEHGFRSLGRATSVIGPYQGQVGIARRPWLGANRPTAIAYLRAYRAALTALAADRSGGVATLTATDPTLTQDAAQQTYDAMFASGSGFQRTCDLDLEGIRTALRLRATFQPPGAGTDPAPFVDTTFG